MLINTDRQRINNTIVMCIIMLLGVIYMHLTNDFMYHRYALIVIYMGYYYHSVLNNLLLYR